MLRNLHSEEKFNEVLEGLKGIRPYRTITKNGRKTVIWNKAQNHGGVYKRQATEAEMKCMWIFAQVSKECKNYVNNNHINQLKTIYKPIVKNHELIRALRPGAKFKATDLNHCYWRMAYKLGYISERLYNKCLVSKDNELYDTYKLFRNKSLACIKSLTTEEHFDIEGKRIKVEYHGDDRLNQLYTDLRNRAYKIMDEAKKTAKDGFIMYKTDCIYYRSKYQDQIEELFGIKDMHYTTKDCEVINNKYFLMEGESKPKTFK